MFFETSYSDLRDLRGAAGKALRLASTTPSQGVSIPSVPSIPAPPASSIPLWQQQGFTDKGTWKRAGRPGLIIAGPALSVPTISLPGDPGATPATDPAAASGGGLSGILSGIPRNVLLIGGAVLVFMLVKKR